LSQQNTSPAESRDGAIGFVMEILKKRMSNWIWCRKHYQC